MKPRFSLLLVLLVPTMSSCKLAEMYEQEYVFYDPEAKEAGKSAPQSAAEMAAPQTETPALAGTDRSHGAVDLNRLFQLGAVLDEINRAIRDGLDHDGQLRAKRADVELELVWRRREAGEAYGQERQRRLQALRNFATQKDG